MYNICDPRHNLCEIAQQMILLEDHLKHPAKRCPDCVSKHLLAIMAFANEAISLDKQAKYRELCREIIVVAENIWETLFIVNAPCDIKKTCNALRDLRKRIVFAMCMSK
jgi:hypothetical protein